MLWLVILFPLLGSILNGLILPRSYKKLSYAVGVLSVLASFSCALAVFINFMNAGDSETIVLGFNWISAGSINIPFELVLDRLSGMMILFITGIALLVHIYAGGYLNLEEQTYRFFSYLNLFVFMMLLLVLANNMLIMLIGWEGIGLCSYLLVGYWFSKEEDAAAAMKVFFINRIGDVGFLIGICLTYKYFGTISFTELKLLVTNSPIIDASIIVGIGWITLSLFIGVCGKSAQIPLYTWLPETIVGPTPVSALIQTATMASAGIYMMTRLNFLYFLAPDTQLIVASVGGATALFAATIAIVQSDIKKVLAYSTISQLGLMILACGVGAYSAGFFHLVTHSFIKVLLVLGAGSVVVAMQHKHDMFEMGGLRKYMPVTNVVMLIGVLAIIGFPGFSGFFSSEEILWKVYIGGGPWLWSVALITAGLTSFYMVRLYCLTFIGENRSDQQTKDLLQESPVKMWGPLVLLALVCIVVGFLAVPPLIGESFSMPNYFENYLAPIIEIPPQAKSHWAFLSEEYSRNLELTLVGSFISVLIFSAIYSFILYGKGPKPTTVTLMNKFHNIHQTLLNNYWVDEFFRDFLINPLKDLALFLWKIIDNRVIDGIVSAVGQLCLMVSGLTSFGMSGSLNRHSTMVLIGLVCLLTVLLI